MKKDNLEKFIEILLSNWFRRVLIFGVVLLCTWDIILICAIELTGGVSNSPIVQWIRK